MSMGVQGMTTKADYFALFLNESHGAVKYLRIVARQVDSLLTFHADERISLRDAQQRLILLRTARCTAHWQVEDRARINGFHSQTLPRARFPRSLLLGPEKSPAGRGAENREAHSIPGW